MQKRSATTLLGVTRYICSCTFDRVSFVVVAVVVVLLCLLLLLPCYMGSHAPSVEDLCPLLEGECCYVRSLPWLKTVPTT